MSQVQRIILVGHCGFDGSALERTVRATFPEVQVIHAHDEQTLERLADGASLLLVNRVLGGHFADDSGVALIQRMRERQGGARLMLISNYPEAQAAAVEAGAHPGFGKSQMNTLGPQRIRQATEDGV